MCFFGHGLWTATWIQDLYYWFIEDWIFILHDIALLLDTAEAQDCKCRASSTESKFQLLCKSIKAIAFPSWSVSRSQNHSHGLMYIVHIWFMCHMIIWLQWLLKLKRVEAPRGMHLPKGDVNYQLLGLLGFKNFEQLQRSKRYQTSF